MPQAAGVDAQQQMGHARVADDRGFVDVLQRHSCAASQCSCDPVQGVHRGGLQHPRAVLLGRGKADSGNEVVAVERLRVHHGRYPQFLPRLEVHQEADYRSAAEVVGDAVSLTHGVAGLHGHNVVAAQDCGNLVVRGFHRLRHAPHHPEVRLWIDARGAHVIGKPLKLCGLVCEIRGLKLTVDLSDAVVDVYVSQLTAAEYLLDAGTALLRNGNAYVPGHTSPARQPCPGCSLVISKQPALDGVGLSH